ncbi:MAG: molecular chaperone DnaJ [Deltaproteobacteria bacterium]|nr:molecular chaperone DnaJ [Deltaproteobacteria bacterium]
MSKRDYYEVLGVEKSADGAEIKKAYRKKALEYHPDRNQGNPEAEEKLKEINEAFAVLSDDERREKYDRFGHEGLSGMGGFDFSGMGINDLFNEFFGSVFGGGMGGQSARGRDIVIEAPVAFEEAAFGVEKTLEVPRHVACDTCDGSGAAAGSKPTTCSVCHGRGEIRIQQGFFTLARTCSNCHGSGQIIENPCEDCGGDGLLEETSEVVVDIPAGSYSGLKIRMRGKGEESPAGGPSGDLYVVIRVEDHDIFEREEDHVICEIPISFTQAALGARIDVPTLDGIITMKIPAGTQSETIFRLKRKGFPRLQRHGRGDQLVKVQVEVPTKLSKRQRELLEEFEEESSGSSESSTPARHGFLEKLKHLFQSDA